MTGAIPPTNDLNIINAELTALVGSALALLDGYLTVT